MCSPAFRESATSPSSSTDESVPDACADDTANYCRFLAAMLSHAILALSSLSQRDNAIAGTDDAHATITDTDGAFEVSAFATSAAKAGRLLGQHDPSRTRAYLEMCLES
jgi:hypothetical protein